MIELRGVLADFYDDTVVVEVTRHAGAEREVIAGVHGWRLVLHGSGPQAQSPAEVLKWIEDKLGPTRRARLVIEPWLP